jgi:hypothetical protein
MAVRKTIALDWASVFLLLRGNIFMWWKTPPKGNPAFLRHAACLEGRVLAGLEIRTALLSQ